MVPGETQYIGDGVYVKYEEGMYVLMANSHINPSDIIYLEPRVFEALVQFRNNNKRVLEEKGYDE